MCLTVRNDYKRIPAQPRGENRRQTVPLATAVVSGGDKVERRNQAMRSQTTNQAKSADHSLTDQILTFCASGRFGVREAIAAAQQEAVALENGSATLTDAEPPVEAINPRRLASSTAPELGEEATLQP